MKKSLFLKQLLLALLILSFSSVAFAFDFDVNLVESGDYVGFAKDAYCGPDGRIHLSYMNDAGGDYSLTNDALKYAVYDGDSWSVETVIAPGDSLSSNTSIAIDSSGYPHIIFNYTCDAVDHHQDLDHAWWDGSQWQTENIFDGETADYRPGHPTLAISDSNIMNVFYHLYNSSESASEMFWATKQLPSGSWETEKLEGVFGSHTSMALDSNGYPHVSYRKDCADQSLGYSFYDGTSWTHEEVVSEDAGAYGTCIAFDPEGNPCISYSKSDYSYDDIYYAFKDNSVWVVESVDVDSSAMREFTNLDFASDGTPFIAYMDEEFVPGVVKVAKKDSVEGWTISPVYEEAGNSEACQLINTSMVLDKQNYVHVFFNGYNASDDIDAGIYHSVSVESQAPYNVTINDGSSGGGGCNVVSFIPISLLLLAPLAFLLRKR